MSFEKAIGMDNSVNSGGVAIDGFHSHHCEYRWAAKHYSDLEPTHTHILHTDLQVPGHKGCQLKCNKTPHVETLKITQIIISTTDIQWITLQSMSWLNERK